VGLLTACYVSDDALIPAGEAVLPMDHGLTLCPDQPDNCVSMHVDGDGYVTAPDADPDETGAARFYPLTQVDGRQIFLLEAHDTEDAAFTYLVARRASADAAGSADMELALVTCSDLTEAQETAFLAAGGSISAGWGSECRAPDLQTLTATLREVYREKLADETWWAEGGAD
jgi:hypothetical protein